MRREREGAARPAPQCAPMSQRADLLRFTGPRPALPARSVRSLPLSLPLFFSASYSPVSLVRPALLPPFPPRMAQKENAYPWPYGRQTVRAVPLPLPPPAWRVPAWGFGVPRGPGAGRNPPNRPRFCSDVCVPRVCWLEPGPVICNYILSGAANLNLTSLRGPSTGLSLLVTYTCYLGRADRFRGSQPLSRNNRLSRK